MPHNKTLTQEERNDVMNDAICVATTILHDAIVYVGAKKDLSAGVTAPDGTKYRLTLIEETPST